MKLTDITRDLYQRVALFENDTGYTGGGATNLDGVVTAVVVPAGGAASGGVFCPVVIGSQVHWYRLRTGTDATNSPYVIRPTDFNSSTNAKVWELEGLTMNNLNVKGVATLNADPANPLEAATKQYVDMVAQGIKDAKDSVRAKTTTALPANTRTGNVLTASANGAFPAQDGVTLALNDPILVDAEATGANNGIYTLTQVGDGSNPWKLTRRTDADSSVEVTAGMYCYVTEGTTYGDSGWLLTTNDPITLNTTALNFVQFTGAGQITAGNGMVKVGNTLHVAQSGVYTAGAIPFAGSATTLTFDATNLFWDASNFRIGLLTAAPTHTLTLASTSTGLASYNTSDQTTNYERATLLWSSNAFSVLMEKGGSGVNRTFNVSGTYAAASGTQIAHSVTPTINQSGTAAYTAFQINVTESGLGSGTARLMDVIVGGSSKFIIDNGGNVGIAITPVYRLDVSTLSTVTSGQVMGCRYQISAQNVTDSSGQYFGMTVYCLKNVGAGNLTGSLTGIYFECRNGTTQTVSLTDGVVVQMGNSAAGTITNSRAIHVLSPLSSGTITTCSGLIIEAQKVTGTGTGYGIVQNSTSDFNQILGKTLFGTAAYNPLESIHTVGRVALETSQSYATSKFDSQGVAWSSAGYNAIIFNGISTDRPEISWIRGGRTYPEFAIRQHVTNDKGGQFWAGPGTAAPTRVLSITAIGIGLFAQMAPTAYLHLDAGTSAASTSPLKFTSGTLLTTKEAGAVGYNNDFYATRNGGTVRFGLGGSIFDHFADAGNTTTTETDLYSDTLAASTFDANGVKVFADYGGTFVSSGTATRQIKVYFGGTVILDTGALSISASASWSIYVVLIRASSSEVRYFAALQTSSAALASYASAGAVTGLTLTNTQILKITGQAAGVGAATNDIVAKMGQVSVLAPA